MEGNITTAMARAYPRHDWISVVISCAYVYLPAAVVFWLLSFLQVLLVSLLSLVISCIITYMKLLLIFVISFIIGLFVIGPMDSFLVALVLTALAQDVQLERRLDQTSRHVNE